MAGKAGRVASLLFQAVGAASLAGLVAVNPTITSALSGAFAKVASVFPKVASFVSVNSTAIAGGAVGAGALDILDGLRSVYKGVTNSANLSARESGLSIIDQGSNAFGKLKGLYASMQRRGALQSLVGVAAVVVGVLALTGVVFNPYGLAVVGVAAVGVLVGAQIHKAVISRKIAIEQEKYDAINPPPPSPTQSEQA